MNIWAKVATAIRGGINEAGEAIVDSQALRVLDQEIRDADNQLSRSKEALTGIIAKRKLAESAAGDVTSFGHQFSPPSRLFSASMDSRGPARFEVIRFYPHIKIL